MPRWARITLVVIATAAVVACAAWAIPAAFERPAMTGIVASARNVALEAVDQTGAAGVFTVRRVLAPDASWIVITIPATADAPYAVVGLAHVAAGESRDVRVTLESAVALNQQLVVMLHADRGEAGRFEFGPASFDTSPDKPYCVDGTPVVATVVKDSTVASLAEAAGSSPAQEVEVAAGAAVLEVADRLTIIDQLVIDRVVAPGPSWAAVYLVGEDGLPGALAGKVRVEAGESLGVAVPMSADVPLTDKLLVVLQADLGTPGLFDYTAGGFSQSLDKPYAVNGAELSRSVLLRGYGMSYNNVTGSGGAGM